MIQVCSLFTEPLWSLGFILILTPVSFNYCESIFDLVKIIDYQIDLLFEATFIQYYNYISTLELACDSQLINLITHY